MSDLIPMENAAQTFVTEAVKAEPQIATMADVGLDAAALASQQIATAAGLKDPEDAANEIVTLKAKVDELMGIINNVLPSLDSAVEAVRAGNAAAIESAINDALQKFAPGPDGAELLKRVESLETAFPEVQNVVTEMEAALPADWKTRIANFLQIAQRHFGV